MSNAASSRVGRGVLIGVIGGLFLGGVALVVMGARAVFGLPDCSGLTTEQCSLEIDIAVGMGRTQMIFGSALALLGLAGYLYFRARLASGAAGERNDS